MARMVIGESRKFPDLARIWHDDVVAGVISTISGIIARAEARGDVAPGDPRLQAFDGHAVSRGLQQGRSVLQALSGG
jgi:AefR-like transcriptional repressor, C-terminal domain